MKIFLDAIALKSGFKLSRTISIKNQNPTTQLQKNQSVRDIHTVSGSSEMYHNKLCKISYIGAIASTIVFQTAYPKLLMTYTCIHVSCIRCMCRFWHLINLNYVYVYVIASHRFKILLMFII